jgi:UDPglucose 6-dehydrogenase
MFTILEANSTNFGIFLNLEFMAKRSAVKDLLKLNRVLIGALQVTDGIAVEQTLSEVYTNWVPKGRVITFNL